MYACHMHDFILTYLNNNKLLKKRTRYVLQSCIAVSCFLIDNTQTLAL